MASIKVVREVTLTLDDVEAEVTLLALEIFCNEAGHPENVRTAVTVRDLLGAELDSEGYR